MLCVYAGTFISSICFPPEGTHEHILVGLSTGDIKVFSHDLNEGPLFTLREPNSVTDPMHENYHCILYKHKNDYAHTLITGEFGGNGFDIL